MNFYFNHRHGRKTSISQEKSPTDLRIILSRHDSLRRRGKKLKINKIHHHNVITAQLRKINAVLLIPPEISFAFLRQHIAGIYIYIYIYWERQRETARWSHSIPQYIHHFLHIHFNIIFPATLWPSNYYFHLGYPSSFAHILGTVIAQFGLILGTEIAQFGLILVTAIAQFGLTLGTAIAQFALISGTTIVQFCLILGTVIAQLCTYSLS